MTEAQVLIALMAHLESSLVGAYPAVVVTDSVEKAKAALAQGKPAVALTIYGGDTVHTPGSREDKWVFLANLATDKTAFAETKADTAQKADTAFGGAVRSAVNSDAGYAALCAVSLYQAKCTPLSDEQIAVDMANPHLIEVWTYGD